MLVVATIVLFLALVIGLITKWIAGGASRKAELQLATGKTGASFVQKWKITAFVSRVIHLLPIVTVEKPSFC
jgi:hypothetical protein